MHKLLDLPERKHKLMMLTLCQRLYFTITIRKGKDFWDSLFSLSTFVFLLPQADRKFHILREQHHAAKGWQHYRQSETVPSSTPYTMRNEK
jgi:hypothetical protein